MAIIRIFEWNLDLITQISRFESLIWRRGLWEAEQMGNINMRLVISILVFLSMSGCLFDTFPSDTYRQRYIKDKSYVITEDVIYNDKIFNSWETFLEDNNLTYKGNKRKYPMSSDHTIRNGGGKCTDLSILAMGYFPFKDFIGFIRMRRDWNESGHVVAVFKGNLIVSSEYSYYVRNFNFAKDVYLYDYYKFASYDREGNITDNILLDLTKHKEVKDGDVIEEGIFFTGGHEVYIDDVKVKMFRSFVEKGEHLLTYYLEKDSNKTCYDFPEDFIFYSIKFIIY